MGTHENRLATEVSPWVRRFAELLPAGARVLDVAAGAGRHALFLASLGHRVDAVDVDLTHAPPHTCIDWHQADIESGVWPYADHRFGGVIVTNYLHRPLLPVIVSSLDRRGVLIYETFAQGNERYGRPRSADFLLRPGELVAAVRGVCQIVAFEDCYVDHPRPAMVQRIVAVRLD